MSKCFEGLFFKKLFSNKIRDNEFKILKNVIIKNLWALLHKIKISNFRKELEEFLDFEVHLTSLQLHLGAYKAVLWSFLTQLRFKKKCDVDIYF
jgi:hypothetical protein